MSANSALRKFVKDNIVFLFGIPLIIGIHWEWWKLQQNPKLVDSKNRKDFNKIFEAWKNKFTDSHPAKFPGSKD